MIRIPSVKEITKEFQKIKKEGQKKEVGVKSIPENGGTGSIWDAFNSKQGTLITTGGCDTADTCTIPPK